MQTHSPLFFLESIESTVSISEKQLPITIKWHDVNEGNIGFK